MSSSDSKQMVAGKSFEYALLVQFDEKLKNKTTVEIIKNSSFLVAQSCFNDLEEIIKSEYLLTASFAVNFIIDIEPRLSNGIDSNDILQLEILADNKGKMGDVRDVLAIRSVQKWEIGVSAKNNHDAVKHSRLSSSIDFGKQWFDVNVSQEYFDTVQPIFNELDKINKQSNGARLWSEIGDYHATVYVPVLKAFVKELDALYKKEPAKVASNLVSYLVGNKDFYKVIKRRGNVEIHAYNLRGTLNLPFKQIMPKYVAPILSLPTRIIGMDFKKNSDTTVIITFDKDWVLSFRIHNASSKVEPSLKFDINLESAPHVLFKNTLSINKE